MAGLEYDTGDVQKVVRLAGELSNTGDVQLSILAHALVIGCKSLKVNRGTMLEEINRLWDRNDEANLIPVRPA